MSKCDDCRIQKKGSRCLKQWADLLKQDSTNPNIEQWKEWNEARNEDISPWCIYSIKKRLPRDIQSMLGKVTAAARQVEMDAIRRRNADSRRKRDDAASAARHLSAQQRAEEAQAKYYEGLGDEEMLRAAAMLDEEEERKRELMGWEEGSGGASKFFIF